MKARERILTALAHQEPDRVPFDLGGTLDTGIHHIAYKKLLAYLHIEQQEVRICDPMHQLAEVDEEVKKKLAVDVDGVIGWDPSLRSLEIQEEEKGWSFTDAWGVKWFMPRKGGLYFDMVRNPLSHAKSWSDIQDYHWPEPSDLVDIGRVQEKLRELHAQGDRAVVLHLAEGIMERAAWLMGFEAFYVQLARRPAFIIGLLDKILECKMALWDQILNGVENCVDVLVEADDLSTQQGPIISPSVYKKCIKPRHEKLLSFLHKKAPCVRIFFHTCGSVYDLLPDLIEVGVDILNPVQVSAAKMDTKVLKREFGDRLVFWGGGVDTQHVLPQGSPQEVQEEVKRRIEDLAPGGGFVFATVHNIQADVPPENIMAMWEAVQEYGQY